MYTQERLGIGIKPTVNIPRNPYLILADDYLILCTTTEKVARNIRSILDHYVGSPLGFTATG